MSLASEYHLFGPYLASFCFSVVMDENCVEYWKEKYEDQVEQYRALASTSKEVETELEEYVRMLEDQVEKLKSESKQSVTDLEKLRQVSLECF